MVVGLAAGLLAFVFALIVGEPHVQQAIDFEDQLARSHQETAEAEVFGRGTQRTVGLLVGTVLLSVALGGLFSLVFAWAYGRIGPLSARATAAVLALGAYVTITLVPFLKYPANPPGIGDPDTLDRRTALLITMITITVIIAIAAARIRRHLLGRLGSWDATLLAVVAFVVLMATAGLVLPAAQETPAGFPADILWGFRIASLGTNAVIWATIGLGFGIVAERLLATRTAPDALSAPASL